MKYPDYRSILQNHPAAYLCLELISDKPGKHEGFRIIEVNTRFEEISGYKEADLKGKAVIELLPSDLWQDSKLGSYIKIAQEGGIKKTEEYFEARASWYSILAYSETKGYLNVFLEDITEEKKELRELIASEENYRLMFHNLVEGVYRTTPEGIIIDANPALVQILGFPNKESLLETNANTLYPDKRDRLKEFKLASEKNIITSNEIRLRQYNNNIIWVSDSYRAVRDGEGKIEYFEGTIVDITERKEAEEALHRSEERYKNFISQVADAVYRFEFVKPVSVNLSIEKQIDRIYDDSRLAECNPAFLKMYGLKSESDILNNTVTDFHGTKDNIHNRQVTAEFIRAGYKTENNITEEIDSQGNRKYFNNNTVGIIKDGYLIRIWGTQTDITEQKKFENELIQAKQKAEESNKLKTHFLANMSHEIRTPMNSIIGFMDFLQTMDLTAKERDSYIDTMHKSGQRLLDTINDIIEMSKIETENIKPELTEIDLGSLMDYLSGLLRPQAEEKNLELKLSEDPENDYLLRSDKNILLSILTNLIKNAIKFTREGSIELGYYSEEDNIIFFVKDTGIGIPESHHETVFDRFVQADIEMSRSYEGSGLGLSIAKEYSDILGGRIWFDSKENEGSTFYFSLPYSNKSGKRTKETGKQESPGLNYKIRPGLKVLVAEDDDANFRYLEAILTGMNAGITRATTGYQAIEEARKSNIDIILMDVKMPELNGWDATKEIRKFNKSIPIIAITAYALLDDREKSTEAGCNDYIPKPFIQNDILRVISNNT
mgnify:CR=1 FL=1